MAIHYFSNLDFNNNQLKDFKVDNVTSDPTGLSGEGQMIYRTDTNQMKYHTGSNTWVPFGTGNGTVTSVNISSATGTITVGGGAITTAGTLTVNLPVTGVTAGSYTSADITVDTYGRITAASSSGGGTMTSWKIGSTTGTDQDVTNNQVVDIVGGTYISGAIAGTRTVTLTHDNTSRTDTTSTASPGSAGTFTSVDGVTTNATGHLTALNVKTVTLPASDNYGSWELDGDSGTPQSIESGDTATFTGGTKITTAVAASDVLTITHDATTRTDSTSAVTANTFTVLDSIGSDATGHVTGSNLKTVTVTDTNTTSLPIKNSAGTLQFTSTQATGIRFAASGATSIAFSAGTQLVTFSSTDNNETYTLPVSAGTAVTGYSVADIDLTAGGTGSGIKSKVTFAGKDDNILITETTLNNGVVKIALTDNVTIADSLTVTQDVQVNNDLSVSGSGSFTGQVTVPTATASTSAPNLAQVELLIAGVGIFQGAYNASTNTPKLSGTTNVALNLGDYFVVSVAGNNGGYFADLEPGDFIFANADIAAGSSPAASVYTVVQADANIAGSGTTDGNTQKGVSGFDSANFTVSANGWVQLNNQGTAGNYGDANETVTLAINADGIVTSASEQAIAITASQVTDFCTAVDTCVADNGVTANIGDGTAVAYVINHNLDTRNVIVSCYRNSSPYDTVFMEVERTDADNVTLRTTTALTSNEISVIITKVT
jgi:hypothetical protein